MLESLNERLGGGKKGFEKSGVLNYGWQKDREEGGVVKIVLGVDRSCWKELRSGIRCGNVNVCDKWMNERTDKQTALP